MQLNIYELPSSRVLEVLQSGKTVVVGYLVDARREKFHNSTHVAKIFNYTLPPLQTSAFSGHCVVLVGLPKERTTSDSRLYCLARNSFGPQWGLNGHFFIDLAHLLDESQTPDLWIFASKISS
jgi:C1A family cysteine protease